MAWRTLTPYERKEVVLWVIQNIQKAEKRRDVLPSGEPRGNVSIFGGDQPQGFSGLDITFVEWSEQQHQTSSNTHRNGEDSGASTITADGCSFCGLIPERA